MNQVGKAQREEEINNASPNDDIDQYHFLTPQINRVVYIDEQCFAVNSIYLCS
jgi:hypothetical protein